MNIIPNRPSSNDEVDAIMRRAAIIARASNDAEQSRKRRRKVAVVAAVAVLGAVGAWSLTRDGDQPRSASDAPVVTSPIADTELSLPVVTEAVPTTQASPPTTQLATTTTAQATTTSTEAPAPTTTQAPVNNEVLGGLPQPTLPGGQEWPNALYEDDILYLRGAVPSQDVADDVKARLVRIVGEDFLVDELVIDPSVPLVENTTVRLGNNSVLFKSGDYDIPQESELGFTLWAAFLAVNPDVTLTIVGHTDSVGSQQYNAQLALNRAKVAKAQIGETDPSVLARIEVVGRGPDQPIGDNTTPEGRRLNRRVEFAVTGFFTSESAPG